MIKIHLDPENDIEYNIMQKGISTDVAKRMFLIGYTLCASQYTTHVDIIEELIKQNMKEYAHTELIQRFQSEVSELKKENLQLVCDMKQHEESMQARHALELENKNVRLQYIERLLHESENKYQMLFDTMYKDSVQHLREMLKEKDMQMQLLKSTNAAKGVIGETKILHALQQMYEKAEVQHVGKTAHSCDIKLNLPDCHQSILFESKYKGHIEKNDITKFTSDIENTKDTHDVIGGVFVSILTKNIPGKGCLCIELVNNKPVLYVGYENESEFDLLFTHHIRIFESIAVSRVFTASDNMIDIMKLLVGDITWCGTMLKKNKRRLDELKTRFMKYCQEVESDQYDILQKFDAIIRHVNTGVNHKHNKCTTQPDASFQHVCTTCSRTFKSKKGLTIHKCSRV